MKGTFAVAATAALAGAANASAHRRHAHEAFHGFDKKDTNGTCVPECTTIYSTWYGEATRKSPACKLYMEIAHQLTGFPSLQPSCSPGDQQAHRPPGRHDFFGCPEANHD